MSPRGIDRLWAGGPRPLLIVAAIAVVAIVGFGLWRAAAPSPSPLTAAEREAVAKELASGLHISVSVSDSSLGASKALVDFMAENDVRLVLVRVVEDLDLEIRIESPKKVAFAEPPSFCLIGPFSAPDDAGYTSPCWGAEDLGELIGAQLPTDDAGHVSVPAGAATVLPATVQRGGPRCDYPPGQWLLVVKVDPLVEGTPTGARELAEIAFDVPWAGTGPLPFLEVHTVAYCGSANVVYREQGEPEVASPSP